MRRFVKVFVVIAAFAGLGTVAHGALLGIGAELSGKWPRTSLEWDPITRLNVNEGVLTYDAATGKLVITATPTVTDFGALGGMVPHASDPPSRLVIDMQLLDTYGLAFSEIGTEHFRMEGALDFVCPGVIGFCQDGIIGPGESGVLLSGQIVQFGFRNPVSRLNPDGTSQTGDDEMDWRFKVTGGWLAPYYEGKDIGLAIAIYNGPTMSASGWPSPSDPLATAAAGPHFATSFTADLKYGDALPIAPLMEYYPCVGEIGDYVWNDEDRDGFQDETELGIEGVAVTLTKASDPNFVLQATTDVNGYYLFGGLCADEYTVTPSQPEHHTASPSGLGLDPGLDSNGSAATVSLWTRTTTDMNADFGFYYDPPVVLTLTTYTQFGWGTRPIGWGFWPLVLNPGRLLADNFDVVYPSGVITIGGTHKIRLAGAAAVQKFLPQIRKPAKLTKSYDNPRMQVSVLAGQVLALQLNVDFSAAGILNQGLGSRVVVAGPLAGMTVDEVLALGNSVLGGGALPSGLSLAQLNDVIENINENYLAGMMNRGYVN